MQLNSIALLHVHNADAMGRPGWIEGVKEA
jgi:hypothetical protein